MDADEMLDQLDLAGMNAMADFDDGIEPDGGYFGWDLSYQNGFLALTIEFLNGGEVDDEGNLKSYMRTWYMIPADD